MAKFVVPLSYKLRLTSSLVIGLIGLLLVFTSQKIVPNVRDEVAEFVAPLRKFGLQWV